MLETLKEIFVALIFAGVCAIGAWLLRTQKQQIRTIAMDLIQKAEQAIRGSGLGTEKKALVVAQMEAMGIKADAWLDKEIDAIVANLNEKSAWLVNKAAAEAGDAVKTTGKT